MSAPEQSGTVAIALALAQANIARTAYEAELAGDGGKRGAGVAASLKATISALKRAETDLAGAVAASVGYYAGTGKTTKEQT